MPDRTFDWRPPTADRLEGNRPFMLTSKIDTSKPLRSYRWARRVWLDQGSEGACTGFGAAQCMATSPRARRMTNQDGHVFYLGAQRYDEWPGENYEGSSVLGVMEYLHHETNLLTAYWWAAGLDEIAHAVAFYGPVEMGSSWYSGMMNTRPDGYVHVTGGVVGGHAYQLGSVNAPGRYFEIYNSWGHGWGVDGNAKISFSDVGRLLAEQGECALPRKTAVG